MSADKLVGRGLAQVPEGRRVFLQMSVEENLEMGPIPSPRRCAPVIWRWCTTCSPV